MALHFTPDEFRDRLRRARQLLRERHLDGILIFAQESHYYLTGYDTSGYVWFQCGVFTADEQPYTLLVRMPDVQNARITSIVEDIRVWNDDGATDPALVLRSLLAEKGLAGGRIGIEMATHGLTGANWERVRLALSDWCFLEDASSLIRQLRVVKSPAEVAYVRKAAAIADRAMAAMIDTAAPGVFEGEIAAAGQAVILRAGGDVAPSGPTIGSGERALSGRASTGPRHLGSPDQLTIEFAAPFRRYNACLMRTLCIGAATDAHRRMFAATRESLQAATEAARCGRPLAEVYVAHQSILDRAGFAEFRRPSCGYSLGATFRPLWMDAPPMLYPTNQQPIVAGMTLFLHAIVMDPHLGLAMSIGHTVLVTDTAAEVLSRLPQELVVKGRAPALLDAGHA